MGATGKTAGEYTIEPLPGAPFPCAKAEGAVDAAIKAESNSAKYFLYTGAAVHIPAGAKATVWMAMPRDLPADKMETCFVSSLPKLDGIGTDPPFVIPGLEKPDERGLIKVVVWNRRSRDRSLPAFSPVAELEVGWDVVKPEELALDHDYLAALSEEHLALLDEIEFDTARRLSPEKRLRVRQLLAKRIRAFALDPKDPGKTHAMKVELPLKEGARPHRHPPSKLGEAGREFITKEVAKLEAANIIRKSNSEWNNRIVLVGKKDAEGNKTDVHRLSRSQLQARDPRHAVAIDDRRVGTPGRRSRCAWFGGLPVRIDAGPRVGLLLPASSRERQEAHVLQQWAPQIRVELPPVRHREWTVVHVPPHGCSAGRFGVGHLLPVLR